MLERARFLKAFVQRPFDTASITPSSRFLARAMLLGCDLESAHRVVELGPGTGVFTKEITARLRESAELTCLELNEELSRSLVLRFPKARIVTDSAENLQSHFGPLVHLDCVISGLPWVLFSIGRQRELLEPAWRMLKPGGHFSTFAYTHNSAFHTARRFRSLLQELFTEVEISRTVWRNLPPAFVYKCRK